MDRTCMHCEKTKPLGDFYKNSTYKDGHERTCKSCRSEKRKIRYAEDPEKELSRNRKWAAENPDKLREIDRRYKEKNRAKINEKAKERRAANPEHYRTIGRKSYYKNRDRILAEKRNHRLEHGEEIRAKERVHREANREKVNEQAREYRERNPDKWAAYSREWVKNNRDKVNRARRKWYRNNPDIMKQHVSKRRAIKKMVPNEDISREILYKRDKGICYLCDTSVDYNEFHEEHVIPLSRTELNPTHTYDNVKVACGPCNARKGNKTPDEYFKWLESFLDET